MQHLALCFHVFSSLCYLRVDLANVPFYRDFWDESRSGKLFRKLRQEPLIPLGLALTCYALLGATRSIRRGDKEQTNRFFRARVYAQGFTLVCVCAGAIYWKEDREKRKMYQGLLGEKRAREKKEAWIRELEARDREEEVERRKRAARRAGISMEEFGAIEAARQAAEGGTTNLSLVDDGVGLRRLLTGRGVLDRAMAVWWGRGG